MITLPLSVNRYYGFAYHNLLRTPALADVIDRYASLSRCDDVLLNMLVSHVTRLPPVKVSQHKPPSTQHSTTSERVTAHRHLQACTNVWVRQVFGYMPLRRSEMRLDPVLFKDDVSMVRKKYRQLERVSSQWAGSSRGID